MPFGIMGRTGQGMRQVVGFGIGPREGVRLGSHLGRAIVTNGDFGVRTITPRTFTPDNSPFIGSTAIVR